MPNVRDAGRTPATPRTISDRGICQSDSRASWPHQECTEGRWLFCRARLTPAPGRRLALLAVPRQGGLRAVDRSCLIQTGVNLNRSFRLPV